VGGRRTTNDPQTPLHSTAGAAKPAHSLANVAPSNVLECPHERLLKKLLPLKHALSCCGIPQQPTASLSREDETRGTSLANHGSTIAADSEDVDERLITARHSRQQRPVANLNKPENLSPPQHPSSVGSKNCSPSSHAARSCSVAEI